MTKSLTLISWNVNGIRAVERKDFATWMAKGKYPVVCVQETKVSDSALLSDELRNLDGYTSYWNCAKEKKGYSGVAAYIKSPLVPLLQRGKEGDLSVTTDFGNTILSKEGRIMQLEFEWGILLNVYFPNGGGGPARLAYKLQFYKEFLAYVTGLVKEGKKVVFCGDVNTAHHAIDLARPKENVLRSGFMPIEREWLDKFEAAGFVDTYRFIHKDKVQYSWWDLKTFARSRNVGWRIDYFWVSANMKPQVEDAFILDHVMGSDHCPVGVTLKV